MQATVTDKGQGTVPKAIRDKIGLVPGSRLDLTLMEDGSPRFASFPAERVACSGFSTGRGRRHWKSNRWRKGSPGRGIRGTSPLDRSRYECPGSAPDPRPRSASPESQGPFRFPGGGKTGFSSSPTSSLPSCAGPWKAATDIPVPKSMPPFPPFRSVGPSPPNLPVPWKRPWRSAEPSRPDSRIA